MIRLLVAIFLLLCQNSFAEKSNPPLSEDAVWMIVMNIPDALQLEGRHGCPDIELRPVGSFLMFVQLRNGCPTSGSGMIDNYTMDRRTGQIWTGVDNKKYIDSERLRRLRALLGKK